MKLSFPQLKTLIATYIAENKISVATFNETRANSVALLDEIGKIFTIESRYVDKLGLFEGEELPLGKTIEEWQADLILPEDYDPQGAGAMSPHESTYRPVSFSYTLGRKKIPQTIRYNDLERAVLNTEQLATLVASKTKAMEDSEVVFRYAMKRQAVGVLATRCVSAMTLASAGVTIADPTTSVGASAIAVNTLVAVTSTGKVYNVVKPIGANSGLTGATAVSGGYMVELTLVTSLAKPVDTTTGEAFIKDVKAKVEVASDNSEGNSLNGNTLGATDGLVLLVKQGIMPVIDVDVQAGAFHLDKVALPSEVIALPDFGNADDGIYAVLMDRRGMKLHNSYRAVRENQNGDGDFLNLFRHTENTCHISRNTFVHVWKNA